MKPPLNILMTTDTIGGVWTYCLELARALGPDRARIALAAMGPGASEAQRAEVAALPHVVLMEGKFSLEWMDEPWAEVDAAGRWLLDVADLMKPDIVHLNGYAHAALPWKAPALVAAHSCVLSWWKAVKSAPAPARFSEYRRRIEAGLQAAALVIAPTAAMLAALDAHYEFDSGRRVIPNGRDGTRFPPREKRPVIATAGRVWDEAKNIDLLKTIAPTLGWPIHVAGDPAAPHRGESAAPCENASLTFRGRLDEKALAELLGEASIYAAPALYEPFGLGILEAAHAGCALVLSDLPSLRENWSDAAVFIPLDDRLAWRGVLGGLIADESARENLGAAACERAGKFSPSAMAAAYLSAYRVLAPGVPAWNRDWAGAIQEEAAVS